MLNNPDWMEAGESVKNAKTILVVTHVKPDGDAIGSLLGMAIALRELGKKVEAAVDGGVPEFLRYLADVKTVRSKLKRGKWDLMISVRCVVMTVGGSTTV